MRQAHAKVNLWLKVVGRRDDGYHLLDSLVAFVDLADRVEVQPAGGLALELDGPQSASIVDEPDNLVLRAARRLADQAGVSPRVAIRLSKHVPVAAGLGGGSADAAAVLQELVALWRVALPEEELFDLAARLGADVPMCLAGRTAQVGGIGETLRPVPVLPPCAILLVNPGVPLPTRDVFGRRRGPFSPPESGRPSWRTSPEFFAALAERGNDLTEAAVSLAPEVGQVLNALARGDGVRHVAMSGSGATCFALFDDLDTARRAAAGLPPHWWRHAGTFVSR